MYENKPLIDSVSAQSINSFENTPESVVTYFYASKIRNDEEWKKVLLNEADWTDRLKRNVKVYKSWNFTKFQLINKTEKGENELRIKIFVEIEYDGKKDSGNDDVTVQLIDDKWIIIDIPT